MMDSDSDTFCDAQEDLFDVPPSSSNITRRAFDSSRGQIPDCAGDTNVEKNQSPVSDDSDSESAVCANVDPEASRKEAEALLDCDELEVLLFASV